MKTLEELGISPAPWNTSWYGCLDSVIGADGWKVADMEYRPYPAKDCSDANCRLIAAAPELYAALRDCVEKMCEYCRKEARQSLPGRTCENGCAVMLAARAALKKAGGGK